jgi:nitrogen fixation NifU-like protein
MDLYRDITLDLYRHPHNQGVLPSYTHEKRELNPSCGDEVTVQLIVKDGVVQEAMFSGVGCAISIAGSSLTTDGVKGKTIEEILRYAKVDVDEWFGFDIVYTRENCAMLTLKAVQKALTSSL